MMVAMRVVALAVALMGAVVCVGWAVGSRAVIQLHPGWAPMQFTTAVGFALSGMAAYLAFQRINRLAQCVAVAVATVGAVGLLEHAIGHPLGISPPHPVTGAMAPGSALGFVALSGAIVCEVRERYAAAAVLAGLVTASGMLALSGYVGEGQAAPGIDALMGMAAHTALGFALLGGAAVRSAWGHAGQPARWVPWLVVGSSLLLTAMLVLATPGRRMLVGAFGIAWTLLVLAASSRRVP